MVSRVKGHPRAHIPQTASSYPSGSTLAAESHFIPDTFFPGKLASRDWARLRLEVKVMAHRPSHMTF